MFFARPRCGLYNMKVKSFGRLRNIPELFVLCGELAGDLFAEATNSMDRLIPRAM